MILLIGLNAVLIYQDISPEIIYRPSLVVAFVSLGIAACMSAGLYLISADLIPLTQSEEQLRTLFENYPGYLVLKDAEYKYRAINSAFANYLGKDIDATIGKTDFDFFPRSQANIFQQEDELTLRSGKPITNEHEVRGVEGKKWLEITRVAYSDGKTVTSGILVSAQDITDRKEAEISKNQQNHDLLTQIQSTLAQSQDDLTALNHHKQFERLLSRMALHFMNLPPEEIDHGIEKALQAISRYAGVNRSYLYFFQAEGTVSGVAYEWCTEGTPPIPIEFLALFNDGFDWGLQQINQLETIHVSHSEDLPSEASELAEYLNNNGISSFTAVPLESNRSAVGFLGFDAIHTEKKWSAEELDLLKRTADLLIRSIRLKKASLAIEKDRAEDHAKLVVLEQRNRESTLITEMADLLQACRTADEAYPIIARYTRQLIPDLSGALYMLRTKEDPAEKAVAWGEDRFDIREDELMVNDCWALRRGRLHLVTDPAIGPLCKHLIEPIPNAYLCIPLIAQGETVGLLHLRSEPHQALSNEKMAGHQRIAVMMAEHIALALSNLSLRDELRSQAIRDPLTNLFNRRYMEETLVRELRRGSRHGTPVGFIMFDIDQMKPVNDNLGHDAGDLLLKSIGSLLLKMFRGEDVACRYGGDEFTVILPEASLPDVWRRAEELREAVRKLQLDYEGKPLRPCSLSVGVTAFPDHGSNIESLIKASDAAIYAAKAEGGDRIMLGQSEEPV
jgi:diguanylate cyclase (GGDEF)-like protein/PAS domain S-box-containing protein